MVGPVPAERIAVAQEFGLSNVNEAAIACRVAELPFWAACALLEKESLGQNVFGHDKGGALSGYPGEVTKGAFDVFWWLVNEQGQTSNGVGPCQITWPGFFPQMTARGLKPWRPLDNMTFGFGLLAGYHEQHGSWKVAGTVYNGSPAYGVDLAAKCNAWRVRFDVPGTVK